MIKTILKGKITAINDMGLYANLVELEKNVTANITATYEVNDVTAGRILLTSDSPIFNTNNPVIWFNTDATHKHSVAQINALECEICCFDKDGTLTMDNLQNTYFEVVSYIEDIDYTDEELSTILYAQSVLVKKGLRNEASKIGAPIPPKKP